MGYIDANLLPEESVAHRATLHWLIFGKAIAVTVLGLILLAVEPTVGMLVVAVGVVMFVPPLIAYKTSEFGVTSKRVIVKVGLVQRQTLELLLRQVEAISVDQTIMGRVFNYGSVTLSGTGGVRGVFHNTSRRWIFGERFRARPPEDREGPPKGGHYVPLFKPRAPARFGRAA